MPLDAQARPGGPGADATLALALANADAVQPAERRFVLLNRSRDAWPYQVAVLWHGGALCGHSGVGEVDPNGPYALWLQRLMPALQARPSGPLGAQDLPPDVAADWQQWWPAHGLWLTLGAGATARAWLLLRELPWPTYECQALARWFELWAAQDEAASRQTARPLRLRWQDWRQAWREQPALRRKRLWQAAALALGVALMPVHLTVRAPGELVARDPVVLRSGVDGTVRQLLVQPNQRVQAGQVLAEMDDAGWSSKLKVAQQSLLTAEAEWRQTSQQALNDPKAKAQLAAAQGKVEERRAEVAYLGEQVQRSSLVAPRDGVVLVQDPGGWAGRTVSAGEAVMKLAQPGDQEVEAWLAAGDAIDLPEGAALHLHLASHPGQALEAHLRSYAFEAEHRSDLGTGYRLRGTLTEPATARLGARGTVRIDGPWVPLAYWVLRRPLAAARESLGW